LEKIVRTLCWLGYYLLAKHLPSSDMPYSFGSQKFRAFLCKRLFYKFGENVNIEPEVIFYNLSKSKIGNNSGIGMASYIGTVEIGNDVMMGPEVVILSLDHAYFESLILIRNQGLRQDRPVVIEDDVWIGTRAIILPGVRIGQGAVVAAGAVVTKNIEPYSVVAGNPAKLINKRGSFSNDII